MPISCIANLCYLPEYINRSKRDKNFYQDKKYLLHIDLADVESKYSFTEEADLEWMDMPYTQPDDFAVLKEYYTDYCTKRFEKIKRLFCASLGIKYEESYEEPEVIAKTVIIPETQPMPNKKVKFADKCVQRLAQILNEELIKVGRSTYISADGKKGFVFTTSKAYKQGNREKYWFAYRRNNLVDIENCENKYFIYGCKDEGTMVQLPIPIIEEHIDNMNISRDEDGMITHWHIVFFKDADGKMTWMLSHPEIKEVDISDSVI